ncbi:MAG: sialidase family protein [Gammaproteobacteria bacterium]|nr:sialidase family protein [Gammaproteobacteria bacterium]
MLDLFSAGLGAHTYRIPALVVTKSGTLLAFAEARRNGRGDAGDIDLVVRRSTDGGDSWSEISTVWDDGDNTCGNPAPVVDRDTGRIWLPMTWNLGSDNERDIIAGRSAQPRRPYVTYSDDDGLSWAPVRELPDMRQPQWGWYATGPGNAIQMTSGEFAGRIVVPANHSDIGADNAHYYRSHVFYSDDRGETWILGGIAGPATNESTVVEIANGSLMLNMRSYAGRNRRAVSVSNDGGVSWSPPELDETLIEPVCQASMVRDDRQSGNVASGRILFLNPASTERKHLTLRFSTDSGESWNDGMLIYEGSAAYSSIAIMSDNRVGVLFERDDYQRISLIRLDAD